MIDDADKSRIDDLLLRWEELHEQGQEVTVEHLCPDSPALAAELARRISALRDMGSFFTTARVPARDASPQAVATAASSGANRGREFASARAEYRELRYHAAGALGEVFMARNAELNREVALKFLKPSRAGDPESRRRFFLEAEVTSRLEHPGIVPIYALGTDNAGEPCYAMRFIRGETLQDRIAAFHAADQPDRDPSERSLALLELLHRFVSICNTMAYAHNRGILHRDLKPRNVMLGKYDETLLVDWGLAKPFDRDDLASSSGEETLTPSSGSGHSACDTPTVGVVGTPAYMSPEQAEARSDLVGPASDIFSLGAILYAILAGQAPYGGPTRAVVFDHVRLCEFPRPRQVKAAVPPALEAVCLKAMASKPDQRYATALELAADIRRWLAGEPVTAWREPVSLRAQRWVRRHRTFVTSAAAVLVFSLAGLAGFATVLAGKNRELAHHRLRAEERETLAINAIKKFRDAVQDNPELKNRHELDVLRKALLKEPMEFFRRLRDQLLADRDTRPEAMEKLASASFDLASTTREIGDVSDALRSYTEASGILEQLVRDNPAVTEFQNKMAKANNAVGVLQHETGRPTEALASYRQAQAIWERLARDNARGTEYQGELAKSQNNIGVLLNETGHTAEALESHNQALAIREQLTRDYPAVTEYKRDLARSHGSIGILLHDMGRTSDALKSYQQALEIQDRLARDYPDIIRYQRDLASSCHNIGIVLSYADRPDEALKSYRRAVAIRERLAHDNPSVTEFQRDLARSQVNLGNRLNDMGHPAEALETFQSARTIGERIARDNPTITDFQRELAASHNGVGEILCSTDPTRAMESYQQSLAIWERLTHENPAVYADQSALGITLNNIAEIEMGQRRWHDARQHLERAGDCQRAALAAMPRDPAFQRVLRVHLLNLTKVHQALNQPAEAIQVSRELLSIAQGRSTDFYNVACAMASSMPIARGERQQTLAAEAIQTLKRAIAAGWNDVGKTSRDQDLAPLRDRDDFRRLLAELCDQGFPADPFAR
jgi:eukaryotic-like serine/threonine-protein kinase